MEPNPSRRRSRENQADSLSGKMPLWWMSAALVAFAALIVVTQFMPGLMASLPWVREALTARVNSVVFVLVVTLAGVLVQALWWLLRRPARPLQQRDVPRR